MKKIILITLLTTLLIIVGCGAGKAFIQGFNGQNASTAQVDAMIADAMKDGKLTFKEATPIIMALYDISKSQTVPWYVTIALTLGTIVGGYTGMHTLKNKLFPFKSV